MARKITLEQLQKRFNKAVDDHVKAEGIDTETRHIVLAVLMTQGCSDLMALKVCADRGYDKTLRQEVRWARNRGREYPGVDIPTNAEAVEKEFELTGVNVETDAGKRERKGEAAPKEKAAPKAKAAPEPDSPVVKAANACQTALDKCLAATDVKDARRQAGQVKRQAGLAQRYAQEGGVAPQSKIGKMAKATKGMMDQAIAHVDSLKATPKAKAAPKAKATPTPEADPEPTRAPEAGDINPDDIEF